MARSRTECAMQLLSEFDRICVDNRISYIVGGIPARAVYENRKLVFPCMDIYVVRKNLRKIRKLLRKLPDDRLLERGKIQGHHSLRYVDRTTTLIDSYDMGGFQAKGMHLQIYSRESAGFDKSLLEKTREYPWNGYQIRLPEDLECWYKFQFFKDGEEGVFPGYPNARCIVSSTVGYETIINTMPEWKRLSDSMVRSKSIIDEMTRRIDKRSETITEIMDRVRGLLQ